MRRPAVLPIAILLAILTAVALMRTAAVVSETRIDAPLADGSKAVAREFYAALNEAISTDDPAALVRVASPDLVVQRPGGNPARGQADLAGQIAELRVWYPALRIEVDDLVADRDRVFARVRLAGDEGMGLRGFSVAEPPNSAFTDRLRISAGRVVEYAGVAADLTVPRHVLRETFEADVAESAPVGLARLTLDPAAGLFELVSPGPTIYVVEGGSVSFIVGGAPVITRAPTEGTPSPSEPAHPGAVDMLRQGDQIAIRAGVSYSFYAGHDAPAFLLAMTILSPDALTPSPVDDSAATTLPPPAVRMYLPDALAVPTPGWPLGVVSQSLVGGLSMALPPSPFEAVIWRVTLTPGAVVGGHERGGTEAVAVESGTALVSTTDDEGSREVMVIGTRSVRMHVAEAATSIRNAGDTPLVLLVLSFAPTTDPATLAIPPLRSIGSCENERDVCPPRT